MIEAKTLALEEARTIVDAGIKGATVTKPGGPMSIAVVDNAGNLVYFARMDGASPLTAQMAQEKARTAIFWRHDTAWIQSWVKEERDIAWYASPHAAVAGGVLIKASDGTILGAIGTSGRHYTEDEEIAQIAARAFKDESK